MTRVRSFATPHKGLRNAISQFSFCLGHTDFSNPASLQQLKILGQEMFVLLNDHVHTENGHTLKNLEERVPGSSKHDIEDHEKLEKIQQSLEQQLSQFNGNESKDDIHFYYLNFSLFQSQYLEHIYEEETVTELLLQKHFTDDELIKSRVDTMQRIKFPILLIWLKYIIPAQTEEESLGMLLALKTNAPAEAFEKVLQTIEVAMTPHRYERLLVRLNDPQKT